MPGIELTWPNKGRVLYRVPQRGGEQHKPIYYGDPGTPPWPDHRPLLRRSAHGDPDADPNRLIQGDNLVGLQALLDEGMAGRFRCICIDPPYNTGSAFTHYDDGFENTIWLGLMRDRIKMLYNLLAETGSLWIFIDDAHCHYLKVLADEVFGQGNFVANVVWQKRTSPDARLDLGAAQDHVLVYAKDASFLKMNKLELSETQRAKYKNPDGDVRGPWVSSDYTAQGYRPNQMYAIETPGGTCYEPPTGYCWKNVEEVFLRLKSEGRIWFGRTGKSVPRRKNYLSETHGVSSWTWWTNQEVGHNQEAKKESIDIFGAENAFDTPKPERLLHRVLQLSTNEGDWVLDSFAGSGTTAAVASQMNRRWVTIEQGDHARTHCLPRLEKARLGEAPYKFAAQGGFVFEEVGPPLVIPDETLGIDRINPIYENGVYQRAVCRLTGFTPRDGDPILHGRAGSDGGRFCHVAARGLLVTDEYLAPLRRLLADLAHENGQDAPTCIVYATKTATNGGDGVEVVRIPAGFGSGARGGRP